MQYLAYLTLLTSDHFLKNANLNVDDMKNYRPIFNLSFISKFTEKVVYVRFHDIDIMLPLDQGKAVVMVQLG